MTRHTTHHGREGLGRPRRRRRIRRGRGARARPDLHRSAPRPRGHQSAGLRRAAAGRPAACADPISRSPPRTTTCRRSTSTSRSPIPSRALRSRRCGATARSSASGCTRWATSNRASSTSSGRSSGLTQPGTTVVCGDSHTSTHGAFGALAMGIGTSEVEHVLATQTLPLRPFKTMAVNVDGVLPARRQRQGRHPRGDREDRYRRRAGLRHRIPRQRHRIAVDGGPDDDLQHEHRGGRAGRHGRARTRRPSNSCAAVRTRRRAPTGTRPCEAWSQLRTDEGAEFDTEVYLDAATLTPFVTWGTNPGQGVPLA